MARIEKTVFISYRRKDISWALAVYQYLTSQKYDVFFDYTSISSGDFEQVIVSNIRARAHFVLILTPIALDRCSDTGDWLRREIETAIDEKRNIIPLFFDGFSFGSPSVTEKLTGKLVAINHYNGLEVPSGYFMEAMERLCSRYLNIPLNAVLHPIPPDVWKIVKKEQVAADKALLQKQGDIQELVKPAEEKRLKSSSPIDGEKRVKHPNFHTYGIGIGILLITVLVISGIRSLVQNMSAEKKSLTTLTQSPPSLTATSALPTKTLSVPTNTMTQPTLSPIPSLGIGSAMISPRDGMILVYVPAGEFRMGSDTGTDSEKPVHTVYLDAFWIDQTEVTNSMYAKCVAVGRCGLPFKSSSYTRESYYGNIEFDDYPVIDVNWYNAVLYCEWVERRLPTEAEWEKAAGWDDGKQRMYVYPWGNSINCALANFGNNKDDGCIGDTTKVGSYPNGKSPYGVLDMAGNVLEWVSDWYDEKYYSISPVSNPLGPDSGQYRVFRGGSWDHQWSAQRVSWRGYWDPSSAWSNDGIRCAISASK